MAVQIRGVAKANFGERKAVPFLLGQLPLMALSIVAVLSASHLPFAQGYSGSNPGRLSSNPIVYDSRKPPPLMLPEAYNLALTHMSGKTNTFYCVAASCLERTNSGWAGWTFLFSNTNGERTRVVVFYDKHTWTDPRGGN